MYNDSNFIFDQFSQYEKFRIDTLTDSVFPWFLAYHKFRFNIIQSALWAKGNCRNSSQIAREGFDTKIVQHWKKKIQITKNISKYVITNRIYENNYENELKI